MVQNLNTLSSVMQEDILVVLFNVKKICEFPRTFSWSANLTYQFSVETSDVNGVKTSISDIQTILQYDEP